MEYNKPERESSLFDDEIGFELAKRWMQSTIDRYCAGWVPKTLLEKVAKDFGKDVLEYQQSSIPKK